MNIQYIPVDQIDSNPWQTRTEEDPQHIALLADSMRENRERGEHGMLQVPLGRRVNGRVQLAFGMSRLAAWRQANASEEFPVSLEELTDRQMSDLAAEENAKRKNLTPIEIGKAIQRRMQEFKITQLEAAKPFGYDNQATIANIVGLLKLPQPVQDMVQDGKLAQRNARMLRVIERLEPAATQAIAEKSLSMDNAEEYIDQQIESLVEKKGRSLDDAPWKFDWAPAPMEMPPGGSPGGNPKEIPACRGCPYFFVRRRYSAYAKDTSAYCGRVECFNAKLRISIPDVLAKASRKLGIAVAAEGESSTVLWDWSARADYERERQVQQAMQVKRPELRLIPFLIDESSGRYEREQNLGSRWIALGTINKASIEKWMKASSEKRNEQKKVEHAEVRADETDAQRAKRIAEEEKLAQQRRKTRAAENKNKWQVIWLVTNTARLVAERLELGGEFTRFVEDIFTGKFGIHAGALKLHDEQLQERIENGKTSQADALLLRRQRIVFAVLAQDIVQHYSSDEAVHYKSLSQVHRQIEKVLNPYRSKGVEAVDWRQVVEGHFGIKLPQSWDKVPVLRTAFNCWECGVFAPGEKLTQRDIAEGWFIEKSGEQPIRVRCPEHAPKEKKAGRDDR